MKKLGAILLAFALLFSFAGCISQEDIDNAVNEATTPLNDKISSLEGQIAELQGKLDALEGENEDLEAELAKKEIELACAKGEHVWDGESEVEYSWSDDMTKCTVLYDCINCEEQGSSESVNVTEDEDGVFVADFEGEFPSHTYLAPIITGVAFNTDSEGYDEDTNTFLVSEENSFILTFTGKNFDNINEEKDFAVCVSIEDRWYLFDKIYTPVYEGASITIEKDIITYVWDYDFTVWVLNGYDVNSINGFILCDSNTLEMIIHSMVEVNLAIQQPADEWVTVTTAEELAAALQNGGKIRLAADIESEEGFRVWSDVIIDLAGYDLTVTVESQSSFLVSANCGILDSVGGSEINRNITVNSGSVKVIGDITLADNMMIKAFSGSLIDLSDYTGNELYLYVSSGAGGVILPDGYSVYGEYDGSPIPDYAPGNGVSYVYVRPDGGAITDEG